MKGLRRFTGWHAVLLLGVALSAYGREPLPELGLSEEQVAWLEERPVIRVGLDPDWPPFSFIGADGEVQGADVELLRWIGQALGVRFELITNGSWAAVVTRIRAREIDMTSATAWTESRADFLLFSEPYFRFPVAIIARTESPFLIGLSQLRGKRVASPRQHVTTEHLEREHPEAQLVLTTNTAEALRLVSSGQADAALAQLAHASHVIRELNLGNLKIVGLTQFDFDLRYAVRSDWPELVPILNRALAVMPEEVKAGILGRWILLEPTPGIRWEQVKPYAYAAGSAVVVAGLFLLMINRLQAVEIARRKQIEEELRKAHQSLTGLNEDKSNIMQMVAHDLRGPLTGILLAADLIEDEMQSNPRSARGHVDEIRASAERMRRLAVQLVTVNALENGQHAVSPTATDLAPLLRRAVDSFRGRALAKEIRLEFNEPTGPTVARADPVAVERVLDNLISNGIKFTPKGGRVTVRVERGPAETTIVIEDTGPGFSEEDRRHLFKKFARLSARPTAHESSTGLGLAVVKALMDAQGAIVECRNAEGGGAEFRLRFDNG